MFSFINFVRCDITIEFEMKFCLKKENNLALDEIYEEIVVQVVWN